MWPWQRCNGWWTWTNKSCSDTETPSSIAWRPLMTAGNGLTLKLRGTGEVYITTASCRLLSFFNFNHGWCFFKCFCWVQVEMLNQIGKNQIPAHLYTMGSQPGVVSGVRVAGPPAGRIESNLRLQWKLCGVWSRYTCLNTLEPPIEKFKAAKATRTRVVSISYLNCPRYPRFDVELTGA